MFAGGSLGTQGECVSLLTPVPWTNTTASFQSRLQPTQPPALGMANEWGFIRLSPCPGEQSSWQAGSHPADGHALPLNRKGSSASLATTAFQKGSSFREWPRQPFLGMWVVKMNTVIQLKARKIQSGKETDGIIKPIYSNYA